MKRRCWIPFLACLLLGASISAAGERELGYRGWGPRIGVADGPDQVIGGIHFDLGEFVDRLRFRPDVELGLGDDVTTLFATLPVHYRFAVDAAVQPYAGGGLAVGWVDPDGRDSDFEIGFKATGGVEWPRRNGKAFFLELELGSSDVHDVQIVAGWSF